MSALDQEGVLHEKINDWLANRFCSSRSIIGGSIGYATSSSSDEDAGAATGAAAGAAIGGLLCADRTPEPVAPQCPSYGEVPAGVAVDAEGCPLDSDGDGVPDYRDQCPGTPAGVEVNANGCPLDSDNDGVPDYRDQCPNTPAGVDVNALGCPESVVLQDVNFEFDSAQLTPNAQNVLNGVAERLVNNPDVRVSIEGHTDSRGSGVLWATVKSVPWQPTIPKRVVSRTVV